MTVAFAIRNEPRWRMTTTPVPKLYPWGPRALFLGPALNLSPHRNAVGVLAFRLDGTFAVADDPSTERTTYRSCRCALIPPNRLHHFRDTGAAMAFLYLDPASTDLVHVGAMMREREPHASFSLRNEEDMIAQLSRLSRGESSWKEVRAELSASLLGRPRSLDERIAATLALLHAPATRRHSAADLAQSVKLSPSRFLHLFAAEVGVPLRRYRLWCAMGAALRAMAEGESLTRAGLDAGFSSSAHFSAAFREMFGIEPSRLPRAGFEMARRTP
jgi:AraC-like DNA-binding protein